MGLLSKSGASKPASGSSKPVGTTTDAGVSETSTDDFEIALPKNFSQAFDEEPTGDDNEVVEDTTNANRKKKRLGIALCIFVLLAVTIGLAVGLSNRGGGSGERGGGGGDTADQAQAQEEEDDEGGIGGGRSEWEMQAYLLGVLTEHTPEATLLDASLPQGRAFSSLMDLEKSSPTSTATSDFAVLQRFALLTLYYSTNGPSGWSKTWDVLEPNQCEWDGVRACQDNGAGEQAVSRLRLDITNLDGTIPTELCLLGDHLISLNLGHNQLAGTVPTCFVQYRSMEHLALNNNVLTGSVPLLGYAPNLLTADLSSNRFMGDLEHILLPTNSLPKLQELQLHDNGFTGPVPDVLGQQGALTSLTLTDNQLTGVVSFCVNELEVDCAEVACECCSNC